MRKNIRKEQVRKRGLPPPVPSKQQRGQAPLPDLLFLTRLSEVRKDHEEKNK